MIINNGDYKVYIHINKINNKIYVGITRRKPLQRWLNGHGYYYNIHFYSAIKKYGWDNFEHEIFASNLTKELACNMLKILIKLLHSNNKLYGYNQDEGGGLPPVLSGLKQWKFGKHIPNTVLQNKKISLSMKKYVKTLLHRKHLSLSQKGKPRTSGAKSSRSIPVLCVLTNVIYGSQLIAAKSVGVSISSISRAALTGCKGGGFHWKQLSKKPNDLSISSLTQASRNGGPQLLGEDIV